MTLIAWIDREERMKRAWHGLPPAAPECPKHNCPMRQCVASGTTRAFWGCPKFPDCRETASAYPDRQGSGSMTVSGGLCSGR